MRAKKGAWGGGAHSRDRTLQRMTGQLQLLGVSVGQQMGQAEPSQQAQGLQNSSRDSHRPGSACLCGRSCCLARHLRTALDPIESTAICLVEREGVPRRKTPQRHLCVHTGTRCGHAVSPPPCLKAASSDWLPQPQAALKPPSAARLTGRRRVPHGEKQQLLSLTVF